MREKKQKFYAVRFGRTRGIYFTWEDCKAQVDGYDKAIFKSFYDINEAYEFITGEHNNKIEPYIVTCQTPYAFVDGSYNMYTDTYGYGGFLVFDDNFYIISGTGKYPTGYRGKISRNVAGEIEGCMSAVECAESLGIKDLMIYYDFTGIEMWATNRWQAKTERTIAYKEFMTSPERTVNVSFTKVPAHKGIKGNDIADILAKEAAGIELTYSQQKKLDNFIKEN